MSVAIEEQKSSVECLEQLFSDELKLERLQHLHYALSNARATSRYAGWSEAEVSEVLACLDELLPPGLRLAPAAPVPKKPRLRTFGEIPAAVGPAFEKFSDSLPLRPYVSNNLEQGLRVVGRGQADMFRYIQHNQPCLHRWLVFDCDFVGAMAKVRDGGLPLPTYSAVNPKNGHSHLFYGLKDPVCTSDQAGWKPLLLLRRIEYALREALGSDAAYGGFISKNPLHEYWQVEEVNPDLWSFKDFEAFLTLPKRVPKKANTEGLGRNCTLFEIVRHEAYASVLGYRLAGTQKAFYGHIQALVIQHNSAFHEPLYSSEVRAIAKSIAAWTWKHYTGQLSDEAFSKRQAQRGKRGGLAKGQANAEKRAEALLMASEGCSTRTIAATLDVNQSTVARWVKAG